MEDISVFGRASDLEEGQSKIASTIKIKKLVYV